jgi:GNAT superfamily N-acetyltransferase
VMFPTPFPLDGDTIELPRIYRKLSVTYLAQIGLSSDLWLLSRVFVAAPFRRNGHGASMMQELIDLADARHATLQLEINPYGEMTFKQLRHWYRRLGFHCVRPNIYQRFPK